MTEQAISFQSDVSLVGTLSIPEQATEAMPAVLLIAGSGPVDRDGNLKGIEANLYNQLAEFLSQLGFVTLRYDKRGQGQSGGDFYQTGVHDLINDMAAALRFLKSRPEVDASQVYLLGHSEGALLLPALQLREPAKGLMLLCGSAQPGSTLLSSQVQAMCQEIRQTPGVKGFLLRALHIPSFVQWQFKKVMDKALHAKTKTIRFWSKKIAAIWLKETYVFDVRESLAGIQVPTLIIGGQKDIQVNPEDVMQIQKFIPSPSTTVIIKNMNHLLRYYPGTHHFLTLMKEYKETIQQPLATELLDTLKHWLEKNQAVPQKSKSQACLVE